MVLNTCLQIFGCAPSLDLSSECASIPECPSTFRILVTNSNHGSLASIESDLQESYNVKRARSKFTSCLFRLVDDKASDTAKKSES